MKILIAEDSPTQAQVLRHMLEKQGYEVASANNGRAALEMAPRFGPALVISDVVMPEMDGYELSRRMKADPGLRHIPMILVTTMSDPQDVIEGLACGADTFVLKPYDEFYLLGHVRYVLLNRETRRVNDVGPGVDIHFNGQKHVIKADRVQILNLLLSTYDAAIQRNRELNRSHEELQSLNARVDAANKELRAANHFLDSVIENIPNMVFVKDAQSLRFVRLNRAGEELLGYARDDLLGKCDHDVFPTEQADSFTARDREVLMGSTVVDISEEPIQTRGKGTRILHTRKVPILDEHGEPRNLLGISEDVTEQKESERQIQTLNATLEQRADQLEAANHDLVSFSYSVSHDLRAPLRHINGYLKMLVEDTAGQLSPDAERYVQVVIDASLRMGQLIDDLLAFSRMGRVGMQECNVELADLVGEVMRDLEMTTHDRDIAWHIRSLPAATGDRAMLKQVFANLLGNAVKYTRHREPAEIEVGSAGEENGHLILFVRDNGAGFDMRYADKLFRVFQRLHSAKEFEGTGIGLAIVEQIVARHGGRVWAEGEPDKGATFSFTLSPSGSVQ
ncbi:MAG: response regulator [Gammaproteobacteria bacterium]